MLEEITTTTNEDTMAVSRKDLEGLSGKQLKKLLEDAATLQQERKAATLQELRQKWATEAEEEGFSIMEVLGIKEEAKRGRPAGTRKPAELKYKRPNGELWGGRGRLPIDIREALDGAEGFDVKTGTFDPPELRTEALKRFLVT